MNPAQLAEQFGVIAGLFIFMLVFSTGIFVFLLKRMIKLDDYIKDTLSNQLMNTSLILQKSNEIHVQTLKVFERMNEAIRRCESRG